MFVCLYFFVGRWKASKTTVDSCGYGQYVGFLPTKTTSFHSPRGTPRRRGAEFYPAFVLTFVLVTRAYG